MNKIVMDEILNLLNTIIDDTSVIEYTDSNGMQSIRRCYLMPRDIKPSKDLWEELGFEFIDIPGDDVLCSVIMPAGWKLQPIGHSVSSIWNYIVDEHGMKRGFMDYYADFIDRSAYMVLKNRYRVCDDYIDRDFLETEVWFGNDEEKLFVAGQVYIHRYASFEEKIIYKEKIDKLKAIAKIYGDELYPGWENVNSYWENDSNGLSRKREI